MSLIPETYNSWFVGDLPDGSSTVLEVMPYEGNYPEHFTHVLRLAAPKTAKGWLLQAVKLHPPL
jgi:hypothetical protein